jgi:quercetin dioxygenase-like cupin family protein
MESWDTRALAVEAHHPQVLRSDEETRIIAIHLPAGEELQEHQVHERALLFIADGEVEVGTAGAAGGEGSEAGGEGDEVVTGGPGLLAHFAPAERHRIRALSDARLVLVLAPWPGLGHPSRPV